MSSCSTAGNNASPYRFGLMKMIVDAEPDFFVTLVFNRDVTLEAAKADAHHLFARIDGATVGRSWFKQPAMRASYIGLAENLDSNLHLHLAVRVHPNHHAIFEATARAVWPGCVRSGSIDVQAIHAGGKRPDHPFTLQSVRSARS
jgi:hypothetical protein